MRRFTVSFLFVGTLVALSAISTPLLKKNEPLSVRNNNPCNIKFREVNKWIGSLHQKATYEKFISREAGMRACIIVLVSNAYKTQSVDDFVLRFATEPNETIQNENIKNYGESIKRKLGYSDKIKMTDIIKVLPVVIQHEGGAKALRYYGNLLPKGK